MPKVIDEARVFRAVLNIVVARGYENATTKELAAAAGMHEATLFRRYGSKSKLVAQAIDQQFAAVPLARLQYSGHLESDLKSIVQAYIDTYDRFGPVVATILTEFSRQPELATALHMPLENIQKLTKIIRRYQEQGQLKKEPEFLSICVLLGPLMLSNMFADAIVDLPLEDIDPDIYVDAFLRGRSP